MSLDTAPKELNKVIEELEQYKLLFEKSRDIILFIDMEGQIINANQAAVETYGYRKEELFAKTIYDLRWPSKDNALVNEQMQKALSDGLLFETMHRKKDGTIFPVEVNSIGVTISNKKVLLSIVRDISTNDRFLKIFDLSPNPMFLSTLKKTHFVEVNKAFTDFLEHTKDTIIGKSSLDLNCWVNSIDLTNFLKKLNKYKAVFNYETAFRTKSEKIKLGIITAGIIKIDTKQYILGTITEITEKKKLESEITRLEQLNLLSQISATISHEVRNPMTTIRGYLQLLKRKEEKCCNYAETFDLMIGELDHANNLITELISITQRKEKRKKPVNLNEIIKTLLPLLQAQALRYNKLIKTELNELPNLLLYEQEIRQLIINMVKNGLDATPHNGFVTIKTILENQQVVLIFKDQGVGIPPHIQKKLGRPFFTTKEKGMGLGLAICFGIAERNNASVNINTGEDGTVFEIVFDFLPKHVSAKLQAKKVYNKS